MRERKSHENDSEVRLLFSKGPGGATRTWTRPPRSSKTTGGSPGRMRRRDPSGECTKLGLRPSNSPRHGLTPLPTVLNMCPTVLGWACISFIASCVHRRLPSRFTLTTASMVPWLNSENGHRPPLIPALLIQKWTVLDAIVTIVVARSGM